MKILKRIRSQAKIILLVVALIVLVSLMFAALQFTFLYNYRRTLEATAMATKHSAIDQLYVEMNQLWYEISLISGTIARSAEVQQFGQGGGADIYPSARLAIDLTIMGSEKIESVIITDFVNTTLFAYGPRDMAVLDDARRIVMTEGRRIYSPTRFTLVVQDDFIPYCINFTDTPPEYPQMYVIIIYNIDQIARIMESVDPVYGTMLALYDGHGRLLISNYARSIEDFPEEVRRFMAYDIRTPAAQVRRLARTDWRLVTYLDHDILFARMEGFYRLIWMVNPALGATFLFFAVFILQQVNEKLKSQEKIYAIELEQKRAENAALVSQINPHFLYNTLNCMRGMIMSPPHSSNGDSLAKIIDDMAHILRYSLRHDSSASVREEIQSIRRYMEIISIRHGGRISIREEVEPGIEDYLIPRMILQPIIENAVFHGLETVSRKGTVTVRGYMAGDFLVFVVEDDGKGISKEKLHSLRKELEEDRLAPEEGNGHIGVWNIHRRLRLLYGKSCGIEIESQEGLWTKVLIRLVPVNTNPHLKPR